MCAMMQKLRVRSIAMKAALCERTAEWSIERDTLTHLVLLLLLVLLLFFPGVESRARARFPRAGSENMRLAPQLTGCNVTLPARHDKKRQASPVIRHRWNPHSFGWRRR